MDNDNMIRTFGYKTMVDVTNKVEITNYADAVTKYFLYHKDASHPVANDKLIVIYMDSTQTIYKKHLRNLSLRKSFDNEISKGIESPHNIPFNTLYNPWGDLRIVNHSLSVITNVNFNDNIEQVEIHKQSFVQSFVNVLFKNNKSTSFVDTNTTSELDNVKRVFSENNLVVYFAQNKPFFSFDDSSFAPKFEVDSKGNVTNKRIDTIHTLLPAQARSNNFVTLDIETYIDQGSFQI